MKSLRNVSLKIIWVFRDLFGLLDLEKLKYLLKPLKGIKLGYLGLRFFWKGDETGEEVWCMVWTGKVCVVSFEALLPWEIKILKL